MVCQKKVVTFSNDPIFYRGGRGKNLLSSIVYLFPETGDISCQVPQINQLKYSP